MTETTNNRQKELQKLDEFIENSKRRLTSILSRLGWSIESVSENVKNFIACPFDASHRVPEQSLDKHLQECQWKAEGYAKDDLPLSILSLPPDAPSSITFDEELQEKVIRKANLAIPTMRVGASGRLIPRTSDRLTADFTREEKCAIYEYVIANTLEPDIGDDIADMNKPSSSLGARKTSSYLELLAQERNLKRRRTKYRGVHTNKKSQVEILREVVNQQMEMLAEYIVEKRTEASENPLEKADDYRRSDNSRSIEIPKVNERISDKRRYDRKIDDSDRHSRGHSERSPETKKSHRHDSSDRKSYSSHHKKHKHKSKDHRKRKREKSRSSRDTRIYEDRIFESKRSHSDHRRSKKRSRSR